MVVTVTVAKRCVPQKELAATNYQMPAAGTSDIRNQTFQIRRSSIGCDFTRPHISGIKDWWARLSLPGLRAGAGEEGFTGNQLISWLFRYSTRPRSKLAIQNQPFAPHAWKATPGS